MSLTVIFLAFVIAAIAIAAIYKIWGASYTSNQPLFTWDVIVVEKHTGSKKSNSEKVVYYITFQFADGSRKEYQVDAETYRVLQEDDSGKLYTQANKFKWFERE